LTWEVGWKLEVSSESSDFVLEELQRQVHAQHVPIMSVSESAFKEGFISAIKEMQPVLEEMARNIVSAQNDL